MSSTSNSANKSLTPSAATAESIANLSQQASEQQQSSTANVSQNRQRLSKLLSLHGYSACRESLVLLEDHFTSSTKYDSIEEFINKLNSIITFESDTGSSIISPELAYFVVRKLTEQDANEGQDSNNPGQEASQQLPKELAIKVMNVQHEQCMTDYLGATRTAGPVSKTNEFNIHYNFLFKRLSSLPVFQGDFKLMSLSTLTASRQKSIRCICFGLLIKDISKIDGYLLIDNTGRVPVRIPNDAKFRNRVAYRNCIFVVEGVYINPDDVLYAANIGLPPILLDPLRDKSLACIDEKMIVLLHEIHLDNDNVCKAVDILFTGYNSLENPPTLFILIGNFTSKSCSDASEYRKHMKKLIRIIRSCDNLKRCHFVFVPGGRDSIFTPNTSICSIPPISPISSMPQPPLTMQQCPLDLLLLSNFENVHSATNPTHIILGDRRISVIAYPYIKEVRQNIIHNSDFTLDTQEILENCKQIILSNAHLAAGVTKSYHSSMNLWHRPDLLLLADPEKVGKRFDYSSSQSADVSFATVPSFSRQKHKFKVYYLKTGEIDDSKVPFESISERQQGQETQFIECNEEVDSDIYDE